jgi:DNA polymerase III gamma/tau subunit
MSGVRFNRRLALPILLITVMLAACGSTTKTTTATPAASATPTAAALIPATQAAPSVTATPPSTPTPLANALPRTTSAATEAGRATGAATNTGTPTPLARTPATSGPNVNANTATVGNPTTRSTQAASSATTSTAAVTTASATTTASGSVVTGTGAAGTPTTTPVPASEARGATEQFLRTVLAKGDISGYLTPALQSQVGNDGYKLLNVQPPVQAFTIDSEQRDADGNGATVSATITTASGVAKRTFVMRKQGTTWLVDNVLG